jgi:hypothetical protein
MPWTGRKSALPGCVTDILGAFCGAERKRRALGLCADAKNRISGSQRTLLGRAVKGQEMVNATHLGLAADGAEAVVDAPVLQEGIQIGDVGLLGVFQSKQGAAQRELLFALAVDEEAVVAHTAELGRGDMGG